MIDNILVLGGTGFVGRSVCEKLVERSRRRRRPHRRADAPHRARAKHLQMLPTVRARSQADVHDDAQLARLVAGRDAVINLVAILHGSEAEFQQVHVDLPRRLARACLAAGVRARGARQRAGRRRAARRRSTCAARPPARPRWRRPGST